jgi:23S rRNA (uridine2552-2'-O)-methyltransferase
VAKYETPDHWSLKAQKEGYPARSVYKLKEIDEKFGILRRNRSSPRILDLGAAPGSWSLYTLRSLDAVFVSAVDLAPLSRQYDKGLFDRENFFFIRGDFCDETVRAELLDRGPYDAVLCDAAPATTGNRSLDTLRSQALAETALLYAGQCLKEGGNLAVKVFQGSGAEEILKSIRRLFSDGKSYKPQACRSNSFETYYIGLGRKTALCTRATNCQAN